MTAEVTVTLPPGIDPASVVQFALVVREPAGHLAGIMGNLTSEGQPIAPAGRREVADVLDMLADALYTQAAELDGGLAQ